MSDYKNLFPTNVSSTTISPSTGSSRGEVDLREELDDILYGTKGSVPKAQKFILRRMRRDDDNNLTQCVCVDNVTKEPDIDYLCQYCRGVGYLWDEEIVTGYKTVVSSISTSRAFDLDKLEFGVLSLPAIVFYFPYLTNPTLQDRIVVIELDLEGDPVTPYNRQTQYEINLLVDRRSDNGRVEYWACYCSSEGIKTKAGLP
jgi:hypothetical protein